MGAEQLTTIIAGNLKLDDGRNARIPEWILREGLEIVFICGEPGIGKTTITQQLSRSLEAREEEVEEESGNKISVAQVYFDRARRRTLTTVNQDLPEDLRIKFTMDLDREGKQLLSSNLILDIQAEEQKATGGRHVILVELVGLIDGLGYGAIEYGVKKYQGKAGVVAVAADPILQQHAGSLRQLVRSKAPSEVESFLNNYKIYVTGTGFEGLEPIERGQKISQIMGDSASLEAIRILKGIGKSEQDQIPDLEVLIGEMLSSMVKNRIWYCTNESIQTVEDAGRRSTPYSLARSAVGLRNKLDDLIRYGLLKKNALTTANIFNETDPIWWHIDK
ncbi:hypothetical protein HYU94_02110 [Candidatus Daviesbacteria bacterium]|nr:hypothetical protein [Candidatus Daviesbacteria bacterium]